MKYLFSEIVLLTAMLFISETGIAQANKEHSFSVNFGPEITFPESALRRTHKIGFGGSIKGEYTFGKHASATINSGVSIFNGKGYFDDLLSPEKEFDQLMAVPVKLGVRYYIGNFYVAGEGGVVFLSKYLNSSRPVASIGLGDKIKLGSGKLDISLRQEFWLSNVQNLNMAVLRVAYEIVW
ncbi:MAG: hypothetical protein WAU23_04545 [Ferruginibacter sp.]